MVCVPPDLTLFMMWTSGYFSGTSATPWPLSGLSLLLLGEFLLKEGVLYSPDARVPLPSSPYFSVVMGALGVLQTGVPAKYYRILAWGTYLKL